MPASQRGLDAILDAWSGVLPGVAPIHARFGLGTALGGPLDGVLAYPLADHWLLVSYGLTELGDKETDIPEVSGSGFELTCRVARHSDSAIPPHWMIGVLADLTRRFLDGMELDVGDWLVTGAPSGGVPEDGALTSLAVVPDVELPRIDTLNGAVHFWQVVGLTAAEGAAAEAAGAVQPVIDELRGRDPLLTTPATWPATSAGHLGPAVGLRDEHALGRW
jgi:hypothetical protein